MRLSARLAYLVKRAKQLFKDAVPTPSHLMKVFKDKKVGVTKGQADTIIDKLKIDQYDKLVKLGKSTKRVDKVPAKTQELPVKQEVPVASGSVATQEPKPVERPKETRSYGPKW